MYTSQKIVKFQHWLQALHLVHKHIDHRRIERLNVPTRFGIKPTLAERCPRRSMKTKSMSEDLIHKDDSSGKDNDSHDGSEGRTFVGLLQFLGLLSVTFLFIWLFFFVWVTFGGPIVCLTICAHGLFNFWTFGAYCLSDVLHLCCLMFRACCLFSIWHWLCA